MKDEGLDVRDLTVHVSDHNQERDDQAKVAQQSSYLTQARESGRPGYIPPGDQAALRTFP